MFRAGQPPSQNPGQEVGRPGRYNIRWNRNKYQTWKAAGLAESSRMEDVEALAEKELGNGVPTAEPFPARREVRLPKTPVLQTNLFELPSGGKGGVARGPLILSCLICHHI